MNTTNNRSVLAMSGYGTKTEGIARRLQNISVSAIKEVMVLAQEYNDVISLAQGTPSFKTPDYIRERIKQELDSNFEIGKYSVPFVGITPLRQEIAKKLHRSRGLVADPKSELYVTVGAMEAIFTAIMTTVNPGDEVILLSPCFPSHITQIKLAEGTPVFASLDENKNWELDMRTLENAITEKTKAIIVSSPTNPTGTVFNESDIRSIAKLAKQHNFWIISDEPYDFLVYDGRKFFSPTHIPEIKDRLIACFSFSKEYAMTGYRVGYVYADAGVINQMVKIHDGVTVAAATISQYAALSALQGPQDQVHYFIEEFSKRRDLMCRRLDNLSDLFTYQKPHGAYYMFPKITFEIDDYEFAIRILKDTHVVVVPGSAFGPDGVGHIRFCYAMSEELINEAFDRLEGWWQREGENIKTRHKP